MPQPEALPRFQHKGLGQCADAQLRPLQVDEQLGDAHGVDDIQPVFVGRKGPVGKVHADACHASFHHTLQGLRLGTGGADSAIKFQKITRFRFFLIVTWNRAVEKWCCTIKVDTWNAKSQYLSTDIDKIKMR